MKTIAVSDTVGEKRRSKRFEVPLKAEYRTLTRNPIAGEATAQNISRRGFMFGNMPDLRQGYTVQLKMLVPGSLLPIFARGLVTWTDGQSAGVKLTKIERRDEERILEYIYQTWLKKRPAILNHA